MSTVEDSAKVATDYGHSLFDGVLAEVDPMFAESEENLVFGLVYYVELFILILVVILVTSVFKFGDGKLNLMDYKRWDSGEYLVLATIALIGARVVVRKTGSDLFGIYGLTGYTRDQLNAIKKNLNSE